MSRFSKYASLLFVFLICLDVSAQKNNANDSIPNYRERKADLLVASSLLTVGSLLYLNFEWYKNYNTGKFHTFNDNGEWYGMDKCGHAYTTFQTSRMMMNAFKWAGFDKKKQIIGGTLGFGYMTAIEVMDGFSNGWGFSWGDMAANGLGTASAIGQYALWNEQRIHFKYSYSQSGISKYNPDLLGSGGSQLLKDYNGQTYWVSVSPFAFCRKESKLPKWLAISFGYGATNMIGARNNDPISIYPKSCTSKFGCPAYETPPDNLQRAQQYYLSLDIDFTKIKTKSKFLKTIFNTLNLIKVPFPTLELQNGKTKFHYLYF